MTDAELDAWLREVKSRPIGSQGLPRALEIIEGLRAELATEKALRVKYEEIVYQAANGVGDWYVGFPYVAREALRHEEGGGMS